jgi:hypothetical protein
MGGWGAIALGGAIVQGAIVLDPILSMQILDLEILQGNKYTFLAANIKQKQTMACKICFCVLPVKLKPVGRKSSSSVAHFCILKY